MLQTKRLHQAFITWVRTKGKSTPPEAREAVLRKTNNSKGPELWRAAVGPKLRANLAPIKGIENGETLRVEAVDNERGGIKKLEVFFGGIKRWIIFLAVSNQLIEPVSVAANSFDEFAFLFVCWIADQTKKMDAPERVNLAASKIIEVPQFNPSPIVKINESYYKNGKTIRKEWSGRGTQTKYTLPSLQLRGDTFVTNPLEMIFRTLPTIQDFAPQPVKSIWLTPAIWNGHKVLTVTAETIQGENILLEAFLPSLNSGEGVVLSYERILLNSWLKGGPNFNLYQTLHPSRETRPEARVTTPLLTLETYIPQGIALPTCDRQPFVLAAPAKSGEVGIDLFSLDPKGTFALFASVSDGGTAYPRGVVERPTGSINLQQSIGLKKTYRQFLSGAIRIEAVPSCIKPVNGRIIHFLGREFYLPKKIPGLEQVFISPYQAGEKKGFQIWPAKNGERIAGGQLITTKTFAGKHSFALERKIAQPPPEKEPRIRKIACKPEPKVRSGKSYRLFLNGALEISQVPADKRALRTEPKQSIRIGKRTINLPLSLGLTSTQLILKRAENDDVEVWGENASGPVKITTVKDEHQSIKIKRPRSICKSEMFVISFLRNHITLPPHSLPDGCDHEVEITPYQSAEGHRGIQIWAMRDGEKIAMGPLKTVFYT
ncbi:MAG: hypothetical protein WCT39_01540 [Candidatus Margulisiibacteriota bacterium]